MNESIARITLDIQGTRAKEVVRVKQADTGRLVYISLTDGGVPYYIRPDCSAVLTAEKPDGTLFYDECRVHGYYIVLELTDRLTAQLGRTECEVKLFGMDGELLTSAAFTLLVSAPLFLPEAEVEDPPRPTRVLMAPFNCAVGQIFQVAEADQNGTAVRLEAIDKPRPYYTPVFEQTDDRTLQITFEKSEEWMPELEPETVSLPEGPPGQVVTGVVSVNGQVGDVTLTPEGIGARPGSWTPSANDVGAMAIGGGSFTGDVSMGGNRLTGLAEPEADGDAVNRGFVEAVREALGSYAVTVPESGWSGTAPYTQTVNVTGMTGDWKAGYFTIVSNADIEDDLAMQESAGCITKVSTADGSVTFVCGEDRPETDMNLILHGALEVREDG